MVDQPKCKDLICGCLQESTHREATVRVHVYANDVTYKSSSPQPSSPPLPCHHHQVRSSKYSEHREQTMLQVVAYRRITTMEKSKTTIEKSGWLQTCYTYNWLHERDGRL